jgi:hypothetical protein
MTSLKALKAAIDSIIDSAPADSKPAYSKLSNALQAAIYFAPTSFELSNALADFKSKDPARAEAACNTILSAVQQQYYVNLAILFLKDGISHPNAEAIADAKFTCASDLANVERLHVIAHADARTRADANHEYARSLANARRVHALALASDYQAILRAERVCNLDRLVALAKYNLAIDSLEE